MKVRLTKLAQSAKFGIVLEPGIYEAEKLDKKRYRLDAGNSVSLIVISGVEELKPDEKMVPIR
jgi:hypothetical protein